MQMSSSGASRSRPSTTCNSCRRSKTKCDKSKPNCGRCVRLGLQCSYEDSAALPQLILPYQNAESSGAANYLSPTLPDGSERLQQLEQRLAALTDAVRDLQRGSSKKTSPAASSGRGDIGDDHTNIQAGNHNTETERYFSDATRRVHHLAAQGGGRFRYVSPAHWSLISQDLGEVERLLFSEVSQNMSPAPGSSLNTNHFDTFPSDTVKDASRSHALIEPFTKLQELQNRLPSQSACDLLFESFLWNHHPVVPLLHVPSIKHLYLQFWSPENELEASHVSQSLPLIAAIFFAGAFVCPSSTYLEWFPGYNQNHLIQQLHLITCDLLQQSEFPQLPTLDSLIAFLILQGTTMREEKPLSPCSTVGIAVRAAQMLGLHKDPSSFTASVDNPVADVRRRVWVSKLASSLLRVAIIAKCK